MDKRVRIRLAHRRRGARRGRYGAHRSRLQPHSPQTYALFIGNAVQSFGKRSVFRRRNFQLVVCRRANVERDLEQRRIQSIRASPTARNVYLPDLANDLRHVKTGNRSFGRRRKSRLCLRFERIFHDRCEGQIRPRRRGQEVSPRPLDKRKVPVLDARTSKRTPPYAMATQSRSERKGARCAIKRRSRVQRI